jgi:predicted ATPase
LELTREQGEQLIRLAQQAQDAALLLVAHRVLGTTLFWQGELPLAREHAEQGIALYDPQQHRSLAFVYGMDSGMACRIYAAWTLWLLGYPDQALQRGQESITLASESAHPYSLSFALDFTAKLHQFRREWRLAQERAEAAMAVSAEQGFAQALSQAAIRRGWALAEQGQGEEGIAQIRQGLAAYRETGAKLTGPYFLALLAEVYGTGGQVAEGMSAVVEALAAVDKTGERFYEAELYRLKGELTLQSESQSRESRTREAAACFHKAIEIACKQQAKSLELRASTSLARLWQTQGKQYAARDMLSAVCNWFTEGFDTEDLQEAKELLEELH